MAATSHLTVPLMGAANLGARMYANPEAAGKAIAGVGRAMTQEDRQRELAQQLRSQR